MMGNSLFARSDLYILLFLAVMWPDMEEPVDFSQRRERKTCAASLRAGPSRGDFEPFFAPFVYNFFCCSGGRERGGRAKLSFSFPTKQGK
jgi:hypothetical protein